MRSTAGILLLLCGAVSFASAQISPGELTRAHQDLEGIENCTQCHTIGKALSNDNCLNCHKEIAVRIGTKKGYHATIGSKQCVECHKEHHGKNFEIIHFDKEKFNHAEVGYILEGKHAAIECRQCHEKSKITAGDIRAFPDGRKAKTYLGLSKECLSCHKDEHRGQFQVQCLTCHTFTKWKSAEKFLHDNARFKLAGAHVKVECSQCHKKTWAGGQAVQFVHLEFASCKSCHADPHKGKFKQECSQCHAVDSWHQLKGREFDHSKTQFPLKGKHAALQCERCHAKNPKMKNASGELGFHITRYGRCSECHEDAHAHQFVKRKDGGACESCHHEEGFVPALYTIAEHAKTRFALTGGHLATPCEKCHLEGKVKAKSTKLFHWNETVTCTTCHADIHNGQFAGKMANGCETCHSTAAWNELRFTHEKTKFPLRGKHALIECSQCHKTKNNVVQYTGIQTRCNTCHEDKHAGQFTVNGSTECERCHSDKGWHELSFDHNTQSRFALTGKHAEVACEKCHKPSSVKNKRIVIYKPLGTACIDCHPAQ